MSFLIIVSMFLLNISAGIIANSCNALSQKIFESQKGLDMVIRDNEFEDFSAEVRRIYRRYRLEGSSNISSAEGKLVAKCLKESPQREKSFQAIDRDERKTRLRAVLEKFRRDRQTGAGKKAGKKLRIRSRNQQFDISTSNIINLA